MGAASTPPPGSLRQRNVAGSKKKDKDGAAAATSDAELDVLVNAKKVSAKSNGSERDYKIGLVFITALAFVTRFWGIHHPNEVVFDEVHFGKVR